MRHLIIMYMIVSFSLIAPPQMTVLAEQSPLSVKECMEHPEKCQDTNKANPGEESTDIEEASGLVSGWDFVKMFLAFLFVLALLYILLKILNKRNRMFQANRVVQTLGGASLGGNRSVQIVKAGDRILIVGVGDSVQLLTEIKDEDEKERLSAALHGPESLQNEFKVVLPALFDRKKSEAEGVQANFSSILKEKLNELSSQRKSAMKDLERNDRGNE